MSNRLLFMANHLRLCGRVIVRSPSHVRLSRCRATDCAWPGGAIGRASRIARAGRPHVLKDIGVSFAEAEAEANKPFWRRRGSADGRAALVPRPMLPRSA